MSAPGIALIAIGSTVYVIIGLYMALALGMLFALGGAPDRWRFTITTAQVLLCIAVIFLWAPGFILMSLIALFLAPFS